MKLREFLELQSKNNKSLQEGHEIGHIDTIGHKVYKADPEDAGLEDETTGRTVFNEATPAEIRFWYHAGIGPHGRKIHHWGSRYAECIVAKYKIISLPDVLNKTFSKVELNKKRSCEEVQKVIYDTIIDTISKDKTKCIYFKDALGGADYAIMYFGKALDALEIDYDNKLMAFVDPEKEINLLLRDLILGSNCTTIEEFLNIYGDYYKDYYKK